jgi:hypothetical protein
MEEKKQSAISNGLNFGLITGAVVIVFSLILFLLNQHMNRGLNWISYLFILGGMIYGTLEFRKKHSDGFLTYGQAFSSCFWIGLFAGLLTTVYSYVFITWIHPGFITEMMDLSRQQMLEARPDMPEDQVEQAMEISSKFMSPGALIIIGLITNIAMSAILGLLAAIFLKKEDPSLKASM